jgi:hypothetical protein
MRTLISLTLFIALLSFVVLKYSLLAFYGLHGVGIIFLLFYAITLFAITYQANEEGHDERDRWKKYARYLAISHGTLIPIFAIIYAIRKGIRYLFNHVLPGAYENLQEPVFVAVFVGLVMAFIYLTQDRPELLKKWLLKIGLRVNIDGDTPNAKRRSGRWRK